MKDAPRYALWGLLFLLVAVGGASAEGPVRRAEVIATAQKYLQLKWEAQPANAFHGRDADGIQVDTPDAAYRPADTRPGWWQTSGKNIGMPYQWGGFSTPEEFLAGLRRGRFAGDIYTAEKRRLGDTAVSRFAVGIDCSGFISRCWKLERAYSTRSLPSLCTPLAAYAELRPGDILNTHNNHVLLFAGFADSTQTRVLAYEAGSPPSWKVLLNSIPVALLQEQGYQPMRYRQIRD